MEMQETEQYYSQMVSERYEELQALPGNRSGSK